MIECSAAEGQVGAGGKAKACFTGGFLVAALLQGLWRRKEV